MNQPSSPARPPAVEAVVFDAYGTLFDLSAVGRRCLALDPERGARLHALWRAKQLEYTWLLSLMGRYADFWEVTGRALDHALLATGVGADAEAREGLLEGYWHPTLYADAGEALDRLAGLKRLILSNGSPAMLEAAVASLGLSDVLDAVLSVDAARIFKPAPAVYDLARRAVGVEKNAIVFVSSNGWDVSGATAYGFRTAWVNRGQGAPETLDLPADRIVPDLLALVDWVTP